MSSAIFKTKFRDAHVSPAQLTPPTFQSLTLRSSHLVLITGPSEGGIGAETAISLAHGNPALLILVGRTLSKIQPTIDTVHAVNPSIAVTFITADLTSLNSVREAAREILNDASITHIDVIINNAAVMASP